MDMKTVRGSEVLRVTADIRTRSYSLTIENCGTRVKISVEQYTFP